MKSRAFFPQTLARDIGKLPNKIALRAAAVSVRAWLTGASEKQIREYLQRRYVISSATARVRREA